MCVIVVAKERAMTEAEVVTAFRANNDGGGIAWYEKNESAYKKGFMKVEHMLDVYFGEKICEKFPHVLHFRKATSRITQKLTHPFVVSEKSPLKLVYHGKEPLLFHNGVLSDWKTKMLNFYLNNCKQVPDGEFSDTRFISILTHFLGSNILTILGDKFVVMGAKKIELYGDFQNDNGLTATNGSYRSGRTEYTRSQREAGLTFTNYDTLMNSRGLSELSAVDDTIENELREDEHNYL